MSDIQFDEEPQYEALPRAAQKPVLTRLALSTGVVRNDRQANYVLLGVAFIATAAAVFIFMQTAAAQNKGPLPPLTHDQFIQMQQASASS
ncbi:MAG TPA: hypothetical protein VMV50_01740 [Candidatus Paceibacterota bacterium]|nr:hypothetical protein [Candidatus Paceibacterota bacterium]